MFLTITLDVSEYLDRRFYLVLCCVWKLLCGDGAVDIC